MARRKAGQPPPNRMMSKLAPKDQPRLRKPFYRVISESSTMELDEHGYWRGVITRHARHFSLNETDYMWNYIRWIKRNLRNRRVVYMIRITPTKPW